MRKHRVIDISTEEKKVEVYNILNSLNSKNQVHEYFGISDNKNGSEYIKKIALEVGFDLKVYKERKKKPIKYCKQCGEEITSKTAKEFCCSSCAVKYNNEHRSKKVYEKVANKLRKPKKEKDRVSCNGRIKKIEVKQCLNCGKEFIYKKEERIYCSNKCASEYIHKKAYKDFLEHPEKYCRGNYTPKAFREEFMEEQNNQCAICGCEPVHNGKPLVFVLDHIDGRASNNHRENLRMICPNCDSQLETFKSKNKNSERRNYWKEHIIRHLKEN